MSQNTSFLIGRYTRRNCVAGLLLAVALCLPARLTRAQTFELLHSFEEGPDGAFPEYAGLVQGTNGNFYGTTYGARPKAGVSGGGVVLPANYGTLFEMSPSGTLTTLVVLDNNNSLPTGLILGRDGNFYGTSEYGGDLSQNGGLGYGTVFKMTPDGTLSTLVVFDNSNGAAPMGLVQGRNGNFYGTTAAGGDLGCTAPYGCGTVFEMTPSGALTTLVKFNRANGGRPKAPMVRGNDDNFYGMTQQGGDLSINNGYGGGTVFKMTPDGALTTLVAFRPGSPLQATVVQGRDGNLYGITTGGGTNDGTVFKLTLDGVLTTLVNFNGANGAAPWVGLVQASNGNFYGTTVRGGEFGYGTVFQMTPDGVLNTLVSFNQTNGSWPETPLVQGSDGNLYGTTIYGGDLSLDFERGSGTIFRIVMPPPPPTLSLALKGNQLVLSWPTNAAGFTLQSSPNLTSSTHWTDSPDSPVIVADQYFVTNSLSATAQFYRLKK